MLTIQIHNTEKKPLIDPVFARNKSLIKNATTERVNNIWLTIVIVIQIAAIISLDLEAKNLMSNRAVIRGDVHLGRQMDDSVEWSSLYLKDKVTLVTFSVLFSFMPFLARFTLSRSNYLNNQRHSYFIQDIAQSITRQLQMEEQDRGPLSIFRGDDERLDVKFARDVIERQKYQDQLLSIKKNMQAFLSSDVELWKIFCHKYEKYKNRPMAEPRKPDEYDLPSPPNEDIGEQWVRVGCQNINIESDIRRLVRFIAGCGKLSRRFTDCYQSKLQTNPESLKGLSGFCQSIFKTASQPIDMTTKDDSDLYLEKILNPIALHSELGDLRLTWASLSNDMPQEMNLRLNPCFETFIDSLEKWYKMMSESHFIKINSKRLFGLKLFKGRDDIDFDSMSALDKTIAQDAFKLLSRRIGKEGFLNWQNVLQKAVESTKTQAVTKWREQFFNPLEQLMHKSLDEEQWPTEVFHILDQKQEWEKYINIDGMGIFIRLKELIKTDLS